MFAISESTIKRKAHEAGLFVIVLPEKKLVCQQTKS